MVDIKLNNSTIIQGSVADITTEKKADIYFERLINKTSIVSEKEYQKFILERLEKDNGYVVRKAVKFDRYFAVDREMLFKFLNDTQPDTMDYLRKIYKTDLEDTIVSFINTETTKSRGSLKEESKLLFEEQAKQYLDDNNICIIPVCSNTYFDKIVNKAIHKTPC